MFLTTSKSYKEFRVNSATSIAEQIFFANAKYPRFLWVCEYGTCDTYCRHKAVGEFVIDATSTKCNLIEAIISIRQGDNITYRDPNAPVKHAVIRLDIKLDSEFSMFEQNNLKFINVEGR